MGREPAVENEQFDSRYRETDDGAYGSASLWRNGYEPNKKAAYAFLDYMLSADVQLKLAREFLAIPVNTSVKISGDLAKEVPFTVDDLDKIVAFDWLEASRQRAAVIERWNRMVR